MAFCLSGPPHASQGPYPPPKPPMPRPAVRWMCARWQRNLSCAPSRRGGGDSCTLTVALPREGSSQCGGRRGVSETHPLRHVPESTSKHLYQTGSAPALGSPDAARPGTGQVESQPVGPAVCLGVLHVSPSLASDSVSTCCFLTGALPRHPIFPQLVPSGPAGQLAALVPLPSPGGFPPALLAPETIWSTGSSLESLRQVAQLSLSVHFPSLPY